MKKIWMVVVICLALVMPQMMVSAAAGDIRVKVNGTVVKFDVQPFVESGRTLVPIRGIAEALKFKVDWDSNSATATLSKGSSTVKIKMLSDTAVVNGKEVKMDVTARIKDGRTIVPLRFVSESLDCTVDWFATNKIAAINEKTADGPATLFKRLIQSEEYTPIDYEYAEKGYAYVPKDQKAKIRVIGAPKNTYIQPAVQEDDITIELYSLDKYTREKAKEILKFCFPKDYETVYMYLIVTMRREVYEYINESNQIPGVRQAIHENRQVSTGIDNYNIARVVIQYEGYRSTPEWFRYKADPEYLKSPSDEVIIKAWDINEYTIEDYNKVRGNVYLYRAYERDNYKLYTYGASTPPGTKEIESFKTEKEAQNAGYGLDSFYERYLDYYN